MVLRVFEALSFYSLFRFLMHSPPLVCELCGNDFLLPTLLIFDIIILCVVFHRLSSLPFFVGKAPTVPWMLWTSPVSLTAIAFKIVMLRRLLVSDCLRMLPIPLIIFIVTAILLRVWIIKPVRLLFLSLFFLWLSFLWLQFFLLLQFNKFFDVCFRIREQHVVLKSSVLVEDSCYLRNVITSVGCSQAVLQLRWRAVPELLEFTK